MDDPHGIFLFAFDECEVFPFDDRLGKEIGLRLVVRNIVLLIVQKPKIQNGIFCPFRRLEHKRVKGGFIYLLVTHLFLMAEFAVLYADMQHQFYIIFPRILGNQSNYLKPIVFNKKCK